MKRRAEALGIWLSHGVADAVSTVLAARAVGAHAEANPIVGALLAQGELLTVAVMVSVVAGAAVLWAYSAESAGAPPWIGHGITAVGLTIAALNVVVALSA